MSSKIETLYVSKSIQLLLVFFFFMGPTVPRMLMCITQTLPAASLCQNSEICSHLRTSVWSSWISMGKVLSSKLLLSIGVCSWNSVIFFMSIFCCSILICGTSFYIKVSFFLPLKMFKRASETLYVSGSPSSSSCIA